MTAEEYAVAQAAISAELVRDILPVAQQFQYAQLNSSMWYWLLQNIFPMVVRARRRSAELGRVFYDAQRKLHHPNLPPHPIYLAEYDMAWFVEAMEPARVEMSRPGAKDYAVEQVALRAMKETENAGRRTILRPIEDDQNPDPVVKGWARVATGRETCGFCMMLVSRGPVYRSASGAGMDLDDTSAQELLESGSDAEIDAVMKRWHAGCDCKVVPVFNRANWAGRDAYKRAERIWKNTTKGYSGKDAINAFRRAIERGDVDLLAMSIAA